MSYKTIPRGDDNSVQFNDAGSINGANNLLYSPDTNSYGALELVTSNNTALDAMTIIGDTGDGGTIFSVRHIGDPSNDIRLGVGGVGGTMNGQWLLSGSGQFTIATASPGLNDMLRIRNVNGGGGFYSFATGELNDVAIRDLTTNSNVLYILDANTALGKLSLHDNTTGYQNTAIGWSALTSNISGHDNTAIGQSALKDNTNNYNVAVGAGALQSNTTGNNNVGVGLSTLVNKTAGNYVTAIGSSAGMITGAAAPVTSINSSVFIGGATRAANATGDTNETVIGYNAQGLGSNTTVIGNSGTLLTKLFGVLRVSNVTDYADNAAAITGGLSTGDIYRTGDLLKIVH